MPPLRRVLPALLALVLIATACADDPDDDSSGDAPAAPAAPAAPGDTAPEPVAPADDDVATGTEPDPGEAPLTTSAGGGAPVDDAVVANPTATADQVADVAGRLSLVPVAGFEQPIDLAWHPDGRGPWVAEKTGRLRLLDPATGEAETVLDLSAEVSTNSERGLLGVAFSPDGRWLYASSSALDGASRLAAWDLDAGLPLDPGAAVEIARFPQPFSNHNGGDLATGPDGLLYWALGDGGSAGDPEDNGQDPTTPLGSILRIDPRPEAGGYAVPADNPFVGDADALDETWLWGLRNPWKMSFDRITGDLWIGDVGQDAVEEISRVPAGESGWNLGWNCFEGERSFAGCEVTDHLTPVIVYDHDQGNSVTGGYVYRGEALTELTGAYLFGDFASGRVWAVAEGADRAVETSLSVSGLASFGEDADGELWVASIGGAVSRIDRA